MSSVAIAAPQTRFTQTLERLRHPVARNAIALYVQLMGGYLFPLLTIPYLARILGPDAWGLVIFAQSFAVWMSRAIEYGFNLSATREVARVQDDPARLASVVSGVVGAQGVLVLLSLIAALGVAASIKEFQIHPGFLAFAWLFAIGIGCNPIWFFQGIQEMRIVSAVSVANRAIAVVLVFVFVHQPTDGWKVLAIQAVTSLLALIVSLRLISRFVPFARPRMSDARSALKEGWRMFLLRSSITLYTTANAFMLGVFVPVRLVSFYGGPERISRSGLDALGPITQALYPHMNHLWGKDRMNAARVARLSFFVVGGVGLLGGGLLMGLAPWIVRVLLGREYMAAVPVLRILALLLPLVAASNVLGVQWLVPMGREREMNLVILGAGVVNVILAIYLTPKYGPVGMAIAVTSAELWVTVALFVYLWVQRIDPFRGYTGKSSLPANGPLESSLLESK